MKERYDVVVVGAGPAGSTIAKTIASKGLDVLLIEKRQQIGDPVRCAEGVNKEYISNFLQPDPAWISAEVKGSRIYAPNGKMVEMGKSSLALKSDMYLSVRSLIGHWQWKQPVPEPR